MCKSQFSDCSWLGLSWLDIQEAAQEDGKAVFVKCVTDDTSARNSKCSSHLCFGFFGFTKPKLDSPTPAWLL